MTSRKELCRNYSISDYFLYMDHSLFFQEISSRESLGSPVVRTPSFHCRVYGWGTKIPQPEKKRNTQYKVSNSNKKNFFTSEIELNPEYILMSVESANCNNQNTLNIHINVEKIVICWVPCSIIWEKKITRKYLGSTSSRSEILDSVLSKQLFHFPMEKINESWWLLVTLWYSIYEIPSME